MVGIYIHWTQGGKCLRTKRIDSNGDTTAFQWVIKKVSFGLFKGTKYSIIKKKIKLLFPQAHLSVKNVNDRIDFTEWVILS